MCAFFQFIDVLQGFYVFISLKVCVLDCFKGCTVVVVFFLLGFLMRKFIIVLQDVFYLQILSE